jgi:pullulanase/glycogen debranching enzyme
VTKEHRRSWSIVVNYITCHDGLTLYDAVVYNEKRNWPNGHGNTAGTSEILS